MAAITIKKWANRKTEDKDLQELAIVLSAIMDYIDALDVRITALGG